MELYLEHNEVSWLLKYPKNLRQASFLKYLIPKNNQLSQEIEKVSKTQYLKNEASVLAELFRIS